MSETQDLKHRVTSRVAPLLTYIWPKRFVRLYGRRLAQSVQNLPSLPGLPSVDLATGYAPATLCSSEDRSELCSIQDVLGHSRHVIISGCLGAGKTALLHALGWEFASSLDPSFTSRLVSVLPGQDQGSFLPILVDLGTLAHQSKPPFDLLLDSMAENGLPTTRSFLREYLQQGKCVLLCDNLHQASDPEKRAALAEMVERFGNNIWVIAQRPTTWSVDLPGFHKGTLHGIDRPSLASYLDHLAGERAGDLASLYAAFERNAALRELAEIPLMAAAMARQVLAIPEHRVRLPDLYGACLTTCLGEWGATSQNGTGFPMAEQVALLRTIAYKMQQDRAWAVDGNELRQLIEQSLHLAAGRDTQRRFESLTSEYGILCPVAEGSADYCFFAPSMQSYLAAAQIVALDKSADMIPFLDLPEWHNTLVLVASMLPHPMRFLQQIASQQAREPGKWLLLARCIAEVEGAAEAIRSDVENRLSALLEDPASEYWSDAITALAGMEHTTTRNYLETALQGKNEARKRRAILACGWLREGWSAPYLGMATMEPGLDLAMQATRVLGLIPSSQSARFLARAMTDAPLEARPVAARSLVTLGHTEPKLVPYVVNTLIDYLHNDGAEVSRLAEQSLLQLDQVAMPELGKALSDERLPQPHRARIAQVLGRLGSEQSLPLLVEATLRANQEDLQGYVQAITAVGPQAVPTLIDALEGKDVTRSAGLTRALLAIGGPAVQPLIEALGAPHPEVRNAATRVLEQIRQPAIQPLIQAVLADSRLEIRKPALEILARIGTDEVVSALIKALDDSDPIMRRNAARYLGRFGNPLAVPALLTMLATDPDPATKRIVVASLGGIRDPRVVPVLLDTLREPSLRDTAERGLATLSPLTIEPLIELLHQPDSPPDVRDAVIRVLDTVSHGMELRDTDPLGLASLYVQLVQKQPDLDQTLDWFERFKWWNHGTEMYRSLQTMADFAHMDTLDVAGDCEKHLGWLPEIEDWLRPRMQEILLGFRTVSGNIKLYLHTGRRDNQRDALLSSLGKLDELEHLGQAALLPFETIFLDQAITRWRALIHEAQSMLVGRAVLSSEVLTTQLPLRGSQRGCTAAIRILNQGDSVARNIIVMLRPAAATIEIVDGERRNLDPLGIGEGRQIEITLLPHGVRRAEVQIEVQYDDDEQLGRWYRSGFHIEFYDAPTDYQPIPANPYVAGPPLGTPEMFYGRQNIVAWIRENISSQYQENVLLLYGERRIGKTSVLRRLLREPPTPRHICLYFDLQLVNYLKDVPSLLREIAKRMAYRLQEADLKVPQPDESRFGVDAHGAFLDYCRLVDSLLDQRRLLIMFDEFGVLLEKVRDGIFDRTLFDFLRGVIQDVRHFNFLFAGAHEVRSLQKDYGSILFNLTRVCKVSYLEQDEAEQLVIKPLEGYLSYHPLVTQQICSVTACHPYFIQYICASLVERARIARRNYIELADLNWVIRDVVRDATGNIQNSIYNSQSASEKLALAALANLTDDVRLYAPFNDIASLLEKRHLAMPREELMAALENLEERDLISETRMGQQLCYSFRMELVRLWLRQNETLLRLAQERAV